MQTNHFPHEANEVLVSEYLEEYNSTRAVFFSQMVKFNLNIFILEKIVSFPFRLFGDPDGDLFFYTFITNAMEASILLVYKLLRDNDPDTYNLMRFKNDIASHVREAYRQKFYAHLKENRIEISTNELLEKADYVRNNTIAHLNRDANFNHATIRAINLSEMTMIQSELNRLFGSISFNTELMLLPIPYDSSVKRPVGKDERPDIVKILDSIAWNSHLLNMPERNPELWRYERQIMGQEDIHTLNEFRERFGMSPV